MAQTAENFSQTFVRRRKGARERFVQASKGHPPIRILGQRIFGFLESVRAKALDFEKKRADYSKSAVLFFSLSRKTRDARERSYIPDSNFLRRSVPGKSAGAGCSTRTRASRARGVSTRKGAYALTTERAKGRVFETTERDLRTSQARFIALQKTFVPSCFDQLYSRRACALFRKLPHRQSLCPLSKGTLTVL